MYSKSKFCQRDSSKTTYGPSSCKILKAISENKGWVKDPI